MTTEFNHLYRQQMLKKNDDDTGLSEAEFIKCVRKNVRYSSYDEDTKTFYGYIEYSGGKWKRYVIDNDYLERIALMSGFLGKIPLE